MSLEFLHELPPFGQWVFDKSQDIKSIHEERCKQRRNKKTQEKYVFDKNIWNIQI